MTAVVDCCHSGGIFDLPFEYDKKMRKANYKAVRFPHMETVREERRRIAAKKTGHDANEHSCEEASGSENGSDTASIYYA
jgi:IS5 family transposase